jgi:hypothetical protein
MRIPLLVAALALAGCFAEGYSMKDRVTEAARRFNEGVRWNKVDQSVTYLPKDAQQAFVERMAALEDELEFADSEMIRLEVDKKRDRATARMTYTWMLKRRGLMEKTSTEQTWVEKDRQWSLVREVRLSGSPLPLWKEPAEVSEDDQPDRAASEPEPEQEGAIAGGPGPRWRRGK